MLMKVTLERSSDTAPYVSVPVEWSSMSDAVSLIIVNYNSGRYLQSCVASVLNQVDEVVVVDNASTDGSMEKLEAIF